MFNMVSDCKITLPLTRHTYVRVIVCVVFILGKLKVVCRPRGFYVPWVILFLALHIFPAF